MGDISFPKNYKIFYILYNITYIGIGAVMLGFGISTLIEIMSYGSFTQSDFIAASGLFIAIGGLKIIISIMGVIIYFIKLKPLFAIYVSIAIILMFGTFTAAIVAFLTRPYAYQTLSDRLISSYNSNVTDELLMIQDSLDCCGPTRMFNNSVITSCESGRGLDTVSGRGCLQYLSDAVLINLYNLGSIAMGFGCFELTTFLVIIQHTEGSGL